VIFIISTYQTYLSILISLTETGQPGIRTSVDLPVAYLRIQYMTQPEVKEGRGEEGREAKGKKEPGVSDQVEPTA